MNTKFAAVKTRSGAVYGFVQTAKGQYLVKAHGYRAVCYTLESGTKSTWVPGSSVEALVLPDSGVGVAEVWSTAITTSYTAATDKGLVGWAEWALMVLEITKAYAAAMDKIAAARQAKKDVENEAKMNKVSA